MLPTLRPPRARRFPLFSAALALPAAAAPLLAAGGDDFTEIVPNDGAVGDRFGAAVAGDGATLLVGSHRDLTSSGSDGAVHLIDSNGLGFGFLGPAVGTSGDEFGAAVSFHSDRLLVGSPGDGIGSAHVASLDQAASAPRNGSSTNAMILTTGAVPYLGQDWLATLDASGHAPGLAVLLVHAAPASGVFTSGGELLVDLTSPRLTAAVEAHSGGDVPFSIPVPADLTLCGEQGTAQAAVLGAPGFELSNAFDLTLGF